MPLEEAVAVEKGLLFRENILVCEVTEDNYLNAISIAEDQRVGVNDALAYVLMKKAAIRKNLLL